MKTSEVMETVSRPQAVQFVTLMRTAKYPKTSSFARTVQAVLHESTGIDVLVNETLAQGLCTAMERRARLEIRGVK